MKISLSGAWFWRPDPEGEGIAAGWHAGGFCREEINVPGCWNCDPRYERYEGAFWYEKLFDAPDGGTEGGDVFIRFNAVSYFCRAWLNGEELGSHEGGYLPFEFSVRAGLLLPSGNRIVVMAENRRAADRIPGRLFDWFNYGGIVRDVELHVRSARRFDSVKVTTKITGDGSAAVRAAWECTAPFPFSWKITDGGVALAEGECAGGDSGHITADVSGVVFWSPDSPKLYTLEMTPGVPGADGRVVRFGIREVKVDGTRILLNGEPIRMRGISLHEELQPYGRSIPREERFRDVRDIKSLGFNALRTAHYTHDEALVDAADEIGLLVLEEIPVYWELDYSSPKVIGLARSMVRDMIARDFNHPSVILWSVGNEVPVERQDCDRLMRGLMELARELDPDRIATYVSSRFTLDKTRRAADVACVNCYIGWYFGSEKDLEGLLGLARGTAPGHPWIMTEFGACAKRGFRSRGRKKFSEDRQREFISHYIRTVESLDWFAGWFIWIYRDFRSPIRMNKYQQGFNRKGIVSEAGERKIVCGELERLPEVKPGTARREPPKLMALAVEKIEEAVCRLGMPVVMREQAKMYDRYYSGKL